MFIDLPDEVSSFEVFEGEVVEFENFEVAFDEPWISVLFEFGSGDFAVQVSENFIDESGDVESEKIDDFVDDSGSWVVMDTHEFEYGH